LNEPVSDCAQFAAFAANHHSKITAIWAVMSLGGTKPNDSSTSMTHLPHTVTLPHPLWDEAASRQIEARALSGHAPHALMERAGTAVARLARALVPHSKLTWVACGPGNNGGDGLVAALRLHQSGHPVWVSRAAGAPAPGSDAAWALQMALQAGLQVHERPPETPWSLAIDALFGLGARAGLEAPWGEWLSQMRDAPVPLLCVDVPSGLHSGTGAWFGPSQGLVRPAGLTHTLSLLTLKSGLYTGAGRDAAGEVWLDSLGVSPPQDLACATLLGAPAGAVPGHDTHKGRLGTVWVVGGDHGMSGAAWPVGRAARGGTGACAIAGPRDHAAAQAIGADERHRLAR
jgi:hydroxyethylthiazole kinase-like uncharacterized protein yjeF